MICTDIKQRLSPGHTDRKFQNSNLYQDDLAPMSQKSQKYEDLNKMYMC